MHVHVYTSVCVCEHRHMHGGQLLRHGLLFMLNVRLAGPQASGDSCLPCPSCGGMLGWRHAGMHTTKYIWLFCGFGVLNSGLHTDTLCLLSSLPNPILLPNWLFLACTQIHFHLCTSQVVPEIVLHDSYFFLQISSWKCVCLLGPFSLPRHVGHWVMTREGPAIICFRSVGCCSIHHSSLYRAECSDSPLCCLKTSLFKSSPYLYKLECVPFINLVGCLQLQTSQCVFVKIIKGKL